ncbi:AlpA family phage regulatory protein [Rhodobacteraceae bacterium CH30]|nr:AlpA family phage regulatory protein [Rhodobacteraceae bacterium CH30]
MAHTSSDLLSKTSFLRERQLVGSIKTGEIGLLPISRATLWRRVQNGTFPKPVKLSERTTAWRTEEIREWMENLSPTSLH